MARWRQDYSSRVRPLHPHRDRQLVAWTGYWLELIIFLGLAVMVASMAVLLR